MREYTVKVKDYEQDITHTIRQVAESQNEANAIVIRILRELLRHDKLEVK